MRKNFNKNVKKIAALLLFSIAIVSVTNAQQVKVNLNLSAYPPLMNKWEYNFLLELFRCFKLTPWIKN